MDKRSLWTDVKSFLFLLAFLGVFCVFAIPMGLGNALNTLMNTAYELLIGTVFKIMAIAVIAGAVSNLLTEFGVVALLNKLLSPLMRPLFGMPGASALGIVSTYLSDNPAILTLADDRKFIRYFKAYQVPALTNLGTAFGMGLIVTSFTLSLSGKMGGRVWLAALCGNLGAVAGAIVSTRLMLMMMKKVFDQDVPALQPETEDFGAEQVKRCNSGFLHVLTALLEGGEKGVKMGIGIIPGVLIICTLVLMLTNGPSEGGYSGIAFEGIAVLPWLADRLSGVLGPLFGFTSGEALAVPATALGSAGAALGIIDSYASAGKISVNDLAVFTAICMCWSGYLSTHVSMMDVLGCREHTGKAILSHTLGGVIAGVSAHWLYVLMSGLQF
jgi:hypothetical protein